jgi:hypothetical protein
MNTPAQTFEPAPQWGIRTQTQLDETIDWLFSELLRWPPCDDTDDDEDYAKWWSK